MESYVLTGQNKEGIIIYQSRVYFDFEKIFVLKYKMKQLFGQRLSFYII